MNYVIKLGSQEVTKQARALPTNKSVVITTMCELTVVGVVVVHTWKVQLWNIRLVGHCTITSVIFLLQESSCQCIRWIKALSQKHDQQRHYPRVNWRNTWWQKASHVTCVLLVVYSPCCILTLFPTQCEQGEYTTNNAHATQLAFCYQEFTTFSSSYGESAFVAHAVTLAVEIWLKWSCSFQPEGDFTSLSFKDVPYQCSHHH